MKTHTLILITAGLLALFGLASCANPAVKQRLITDGESVLLAGGGALLITGSSGAAVTAMSAQAVRNLPGLQQVLAQAAKQPVAAGVTP